MTKIDCVIAAIILLLICFLPKSKRDEFIRDVIDKTREKLNG